MKLRFSLAKLRPFYKPLVDLVIVITGVSVAFLLNSWNEQKKETAERNKVITSLRQELNEMDDLFPGMASYQETMIVKWDSMQAAKQLDDFYNYRYLQPQYNYTIIEYALDTRNSSIVDFRLHEKLLKIHKTIKMLEQAEIHMTMLALQYQEGEKKNTVQNLFLFKKFIVFSKDRAYCLREVHKLTEEIIPLLSKSKT